MSHKSPPTTSDILVVNLTRNMLCFPAYNLSHAHACTMIATGDPRRQSTCQRPVEPSSQSAPSLERRALHWAALMSCVQTVCTAICRGGGERWCNPLTRLWTNPRTPLTHRPRGHVRLMGQKDTQKSCPKTHLCTMNAWCRFQNQFSWWKLAACVR